MERRKKFVKLGLLLIALGNILEQKMIERSWADLIVLDTL